VVGEERGHRDAHQPEHDSHARILPRRAHPRNANNGRARAQLRDPLARLVAPPGRDGGADVK